MTVLCKLCENIDLEAAEERGYQHHRSGKAITKAAATGCLLCSLFCQKWSTSVRLKDWSNPFSLRLSGDRLSLELSSKSMRIKHGKSHKDGDGPEKDPTYLDVGIFTLDDKNGSKLTGRRVPVQADSVDCFDTVKEWLTCCFENHNSCPKLKDLPLPTRVIDVGISGDPRTLRLHHTENTPGKWIALSHRWGSETLLSTTTSNIGDHKIQLPWNSLSKVFQDAVLITRKLGFQYLWIDSLCIIQDSVQDWAQESKNMCHIYKGSAITLAAARIESAREGMLSDRAMWSIEDFIGIPLPDSIEIACLRPTTGATERVGVQCIQRNPFSLITDSDLNPLHARGWILQEMVLSPRTIFWTSEQLIWHYRTCLAAEYSKKPILSCENEPESFSAILCKRLFTSARKETKAIYDIWHSIVSVYAQCALTKGHDIFPAISGIAHEMQSTIEDKYCAGMWLGDMRRSLLWSCEGVPDKTPEYVAPSWSWASNAFPRRITYPQTPDADGDLIPGDFIDDLFQVISCDTVLMTADPLGRISDARLVVRAPIALFPTEPASAVDKERSEGGNFRFVENFSHKFVFVDDQGHQLKCDADKPDGVRILEALSMSENTDEVICLAIGNALFFPDDSTQLYGLLLKGSPDSASMYTRIGQFAAHPDWLKDGKIWSRQELTLM